MQTLKTKERWLREGLQIKANELPVKVDSGLYYSTVFALLEF